MRIVGIETSCDETAVAVVEGLNGLEGFKGFKVLKNLVASQAQLHAKYGGVVPEVAAREHVDAMFPLLVESGVARDGSDVDVIAVTAGPGLVPALRVGVETAKALAWVWQKPLVAVNHLEGHVYSVWLNRAEKDEGRNSKFEGRGKVEGGRIEFPAIALLVSGGHTELVLMRGHGLYERIGATRDDAGGEAFDKVAKLLGLEYPGGPAISKMAETGNPTAIAFPRPMLESEDFDFSFSGLKTAVAVHLKTTPNPSSHEEGNYVSDICASFQQAVVDTLVTKTMRAVEKFQPKSVILAGGVAANRQLRESLSSAIANYKLPITLHAPDFAYTSDNAAMIAATGYFKALRGEFADPLKLEAEPNLQL